MILQHEAEYKQSCFSSNSKRQRPSFVPSQQLKIRRERAMRCSSKASLLLARNLVLAMLFVSTWRKDSKTANAFRPSASLFYNRLSRQQSNLSGHISSVLEGSDEASLLEGRRSSSLWSMKATTTLSSTTRQYRIPPSMFLRPSSYRYPDMLLGSEDVPFLSSSSFGTEKGMDGSNDSSKGQTKRSRGILGFHVGRVSDIKSDKIQVSQSKTIYYRRTSTKRSVGQTPIDFNLWNWPEPLPSESENGRSSRAIDRILFDREQSDHLWNSGNNNSKGRRRASITALMESGITSFIPWIPTQEQVESLTVMQLKAELGKRNLRKTGRKAELQGRLLEWTHEQQVLLHDDEDYDDDADDDDEDSTVKNMRGRNLSTPTTANSLAEWARTVDLEPLLQRRADIHREKLEGKKTVDATKKSKEVSSSSVPENYRSLLAKVFEKPSSPYSNLEVKQMYAAAKHADQAGDRSLCKRLLMELLQHATPHDARIYRRLARMEQEDGDIDAAISILKEGLKENPDNAYLFHGLGQIYNKQKDYEKAREYFRKAIQADPTLPNSYHAMGTMEHTLGRVANAMKTLKTGVEYCPQNHRLHHALGDLYRDAKLFDMANMSYQKALKYGPAVSRGFVYTALAYAAYEQDDVAQCRSWLLKAVGENNGRHANGWVALSQLEESEGNYDAARSVCMAGIAQYERGLLERSRNIKLRDGLLDQNAHLEDPALLRQKLRKNVPKYRSGDRFFHLYRTWARLEERHGDLDSTQDVYSRAALAFPQNWKLSLDLAQYYLKHGMEDQARSLFAKACRKATKWNRNADPHRLFAEFEMSLGNYAAAQEVLYAGAAALTADMSKKDAEDGLLISGLTELFYTWGVCEWYLGNHSRAEVLLQHVVRMVPTDDKNMSSFVQYAIARLEYDRGEYHKAQHYIGLCLKDNNKGTYGAKAWDLWSDVSIALGNEGFAKQCQNYAQIARQEEERSKNDDIVDLLALSLMSGTKVGSGGHELHQLLRRDPWNTKIFGTPEQQQKAASFFHNCVDLPGAETSCEIDTEMTVQR